MIKKILIAAVIAGLVLAGAAFYFLTLKPVRPEMDFGRVPAGWSRIQDLSPKEDVWGAQYQGTGTLEDALTAFKTEMEKAG